MNRCLAFLLALLFASVSVASACTAAPAEWVQFTLEPERGGNDIQARFHDEGGDRGDAQWSASFPPSQLIGFDAYGFRGVGTRPIRFAVVREPGRLDCSGTAGNSLARGNCRFTADPAFQQFLASRGIGRPDGRDSWTMMAVNVRRELIDAIAAARYPTPSVDDLVAMTAVGVTGRYISELARAGYRPGGVDSLIQFRALGITPEWIGGFVRIGYAGLPADELVQLKALDITPEFVSGFEQLGYRRLSVDTLVQLKALDITPEFVRSVERQPGETPPVGELVQRKLFGGRR